VRQPTSQHLILYTFAAGSAPLELLQLGAAATLITYQDTLWRLVASWPPIESWGLVDGGQIGLVTAHTSADTTKFNTEVHCI
jgi:hypothetical protein